MGSQLIYSGIITKIRAMNKYLLNDSDFNEFSNSTSVSEIGNKLKNHKAYADILSPLEDHELHRGDLEKLLIQSLYKDYDKLFHFGNLHIRKFLRSYLIRHEIDVITYCFRIVFNHYAEPFDLKYKRDFFNLHSNISIDKLLLSTNELELIEALAETPYYSILKNIYNSGHATLFDYNLALDLYNYSTLWKERKKYTNLNEMTIVKRDIGSKIDLLNLQWIYRAKKYYNMAIGEIYSMLIPISYRLTTSILKQLVESSDIGEFTVVFNQSYYGAQLPNEHDLDLHEIYNQYLLHLYTIDCRSAPYSIAPINMYLYKKEMEIKKLTTVLECVRYGIDASETIKYIGGIA